MAGALPDAIRPDCPAGVFIGDVRGSRLPSRWRDRLDADRAGGWTGVRPSGEARGTGGVPAGLETVLAYIDCGREAGGDTEGRL